MGQALRKLDEDLTASLKPIAVDKEELRKKRELKRLREFGVLMAAVITALSAFLLWRERPSSIIALVIATLFLIPAYLSPMALKPVEKLWLAFGEKMSVVMTTILLVLTYFLLITPIGLFMKLIGKDLLDIKLDREAKSYWKQPEKDGPSTRPYLPY